jgi:hypothetical protein
MEGKDGPFVLRVSPLEPFLRIQRTEADARTIHVLDSDLLLRQ